MRMRGLGDERFSEWFDYNDDTILYFDVMWFLLDEITLICDLY